MSMLYLRCSDHDLMIEKGKYKKLMLKRDFVVCALKKRWNVSHISYYNALLITELE